MSEAKPNVLYCARDVGPWAVVTRLPEEPCCVGNAAMSKATQLAKSILCAGLIQKAKPVQDVEKGQVCLVEKTDTARRPSPFLPLALDLKLLEPRISYLD